MLAFTVPNYHAAANVMKEVKLLTPAVSLGSVDTLIQHPASLTHQVVADDVKDDLGITDGLLRVSVGLENPDDLWSDLEQALRSAEENTLPPMLRVVGLS